MKTIIKYQFSIICALIFCFILSLGGCYTVEPEIIDAEYITNQSDYEILSLTLKDSSKIEKVEPSHINFIKGFPDSTGKFIHSLYINKDKASLTTDTVPLQKVSKVEISKSKYDMASSTIAVAIVALVSVGMILILCYTDSFKFRMGN